MSPGVWCFCARGAVPLLDPYHRTKAHKHWGFLMFDPYHYLYQSGPDPYQAAFGAALNLTLNRNPSVLPLNLWALAANTKNQAPSSREGPILKHQGQCVRRPNFRSAPDNRHPQPTQVERLRNSLCSTLFYLVLVCFAAVRPVLWRPFDLKFEISDFKSDQNGGSRWVFRNKFLNSD